MSSTIASDKRDLCPPLTFGDGGTAPCFWCSEGAIMELVAVPAPEEVPLFISFPSGSTNVHFNLESINCAASVSFHFVREERDSI